MDAVALTSLAVIVASTGGLALLLSYFWTR